MKVSRSNQGRRNPVPRVSEIVRALDGAETDRWVVSIRLQDVRTKIRKLVLTYDVVYMDELGQRKSERIVAKAYYRGESGAEGFELMRQLWNVGMDASKRYTVVRPIAYISEPEILLMSLAPGQTFRAYLDQARESEVFSAAEAAGRWLATLHRLSLPLGKQLTMQDELTAVERYRYELNTAHPQKRAEITAISEVILSELGRLSECGELLIHGDYHPANILVESSGKVTVIDFDQARRGDPLWDVAYGAYQIQIAGFHRFGSFSAYDRFVAAFLQAYFHTVSTQRKHDEQAWLDSLDSKAIRHRLHLYRARALFESLHYELCVYRTGDTRLLEAYLTECFRSALAKGGFPWTGS